MLTSDWLQRTSPAFRLMIATSWLAPESWQEKQQEAIRAAVDAGPDWQEYLRLIDRHRTPALSWAALSRTPGAIPPEPLAKELKQRSDACRMESMKQCLLMASALKALNRAGIPVMPFKGQILSLSLYGDVGLRQCRDLDLAFAPEDLQRARACFEETGWELRSPAWFPLSPAQWARALRYEHDLEMVHTQTGCLLELHWRDEWETPQQTRDRWSRSVASVWQGSAIWSMTPSDLTLYLCSHGGHHAWSRAKWLGDLARAHAVEQLDWNGAIDEARRTSQEKVISTALRLLKQLYGSAMPDLPEDPVINLPSRLLEIPIATLTNPSEPLDANSSGWLRYRLLMSRYERQLHPRKAWRDSLARLLYGREDFRTLNLPDSLCWAYAPLHPVLWAWRSVERFLRPTVR